MHVMRECATKKNASFIQYHEHFELNGRFIIVMEYLGDGWIDLYDYVEIYGPVNEETSVEIFRRVTETVLALHEIGYYHNDMKGTLLPTFSDSSNSFII